jgi:hypothetical protein
MNLCENTSIDRKISLSVTPAKAGVQTSSRRKSGTISKTGSRFSPGTLDSGLRRNDEFFGISTFYEIISIRSRRKAEIFPFNV